MSTIQTTSDNLLAFAAQKNILQYMQIRLGDFKTEQGKLPQNTND